MANPLPHRNRDADHAGGVLERLHHPVHGGVLAVLDLDPVLRSAGAIGAVGPLTHHALKAHVARGPEQVGTDLALLERGDENPVGLTRQEPREVGLAHRERQRLCGARGFHETSRIAAT